MGELRHHRLLILDDDPLVGKLMQRIAGSIGVDAQLTKNAPAFLLGVEEWHPTHIAIDLVMPDTDGIEVLRELAGRQFSAKVIITSGAGTAALNAVRRSAEEMGLHIVGVLAKPFSPNALRALLIADKE